MPATLLTRCTSPSTCNKPGCSMWLLNAAMCGSSLNDTRPQPLEAVGTASSSGDSRNGYDVSGIVVGVVLGVLGPSVGLITWLAWTYQYRRAKWTIAQAVGMHLTLEDISEDVPVASQPQQPNGVVADPKPTLQMKQTATHIAQQCLRFWDGPFGFRAGWDSGGAQAGVWKSKFDGVRCAALLLAFRNVNTRLQNRSDAPGTLLQTWQGCATSAARKAVISDIAAELQLINLAEAQALPTKDLDVISQPRFSLKSFFSWRQRAASVMPNT